MSQVREGLVENKEWASLAQDEGQAIKKLLILAGQVGERNIIKLKLVWKFSKKNHNRSLRS